MKGPTASVRRKWKEADKICRRWRRQSAEDSQTPFGTPVAISLEACRREAVCQSSGVMEKEIDEALADRELRLQEKQLELKWAELAVIRGVSP